MSFALPRQGPRIARDLKKEKTMTVNEISRAISALSKVVEANNGLMGNETVARMANKKIEALIKMLPQTPEQ